MWCTVRRVAEPSLSHQCGVVTYEGDEGDTQLCGSANMRLCSCLDCVTLLSANGQHLVTHYVMYQASTSFRKHDA